MAQKAKVPVVLHFDHGLTHELVIKALRLGFSSVMYDCSTLSYEENIKNCRDMALITKSFGASLEAELGHVGANEGGSAEGDEDSSIYTEPLQAREFFEATSVDALAVAVGTAHGIYRSKPKLDIPRLKEISMTADVPLVLHGGSGLSDHDFRSCIENGISKINIFTDINMAAAEAAGKACVKNTGMTDLIPGIVENIKQATIEKMKLFGCFNRG
jgi:fructose-bisphosphate aldolase class II